MRKTATYTATDGRDKGKLFLITEMSAAQGESWAMRALLALIKTNAEIPEDFTQLGIAGLAELGFKALSGLDWIVLEPLLNEMFRTIEIVPDPKNTAIRRALEDQANDIEEISTRLKLRLEFWKLNLGFLAAVAPSLLNQVKPAAVRASRMRTSAK